MNAPSHSYDFVRQVILSGLRSHIDYDFLAQRIFPTKIFLGKSFVDNYEVRLLGEFAFVEHTAMQQWNAQGAEIARLDDPQKRSKSFSGRPRRLADDRDRRSEPEATEWRGQVGGR